MTEFGLNAEVATAAATGSASRFVEALENELNESHKDAEENPKEENEDN